MKPFFASLSLLLLHLTNISTNLTKPAPQVHTKLHTLHTGQPGGGQPGGHASKDTPSGHTGPKESGGHASKDTPSGHTGPKESGGHASKDTPSGHTRPKVSGHTRPKVSAEGAKGPKTGPNGDKSRITKSVFSQYNITLFKNLYTTLKKKKTNMFGYEDYSSVTIESMYYDTQDDLNLQEHVHYNFTHKFANNREMYRTYRWMRYMNRGEAKMIEAELRDRFGYTIDQIAELSGLSVARAIERHYKKENYTDVLVMCGSGKNGLYGFVTARHLKLMGYDPTIFLVKEYNSSKVEGYKLFTSLRQQALAFNIPILSTLPSNISILTSTHSLIVDAIFGVGYDRFKYAELPRANRYKYSVNILKQVNKLKRGQGRIPIVSIDLPSGWDTNIGNYEGHHINPEMLVSLIGPKLGVVEFFGKYHYIAGNFLPPILNEKYQVYIPKYNGSDCLISLETLVVDTTETKEMFHVRK